MNTIEEYLYNLPDGMTKQDIEKYIKDQMESPGENNLKLIYNEICEKKGGYYSDGCKTYYIVGAVSTHEDYYYVVINGSTRKMGFLSCVGKLEELDDVPPDCSVLDYLLRTEPEYFVDMIKENIYKSKVDVLFTPIFIRGKAY